MNIGLLTTNDNHKSIRFSKFDKTHQSIGLNNESYYSKNTPKLPNSNNRVTNTENDPKNLNELLKYYVRIILYQLYYFYLFKLFL